MNKHSEWYEPCDDEWCAHAGAFTLRVFGDGVWRVEAQIDAYGDEGQTVDVAKSEAKEFLRELLTKALGELG